MVAESFANRCLFVVYIAGRFVLGFGNSMAQMCSPMLLTEICHPQHRGPLTTVYNCLWSFGSLSRYKPLIRQDPYTDRRSCLLRGLGNLVYQQQLVLALNHVYPSSTVNHSTLWHLVASRITSMVDEQGQRR